MYVHIYIYTNIHDWMFICICMNSVKGLTICIVFQERAQLYSGTQLMFTYAITHSNPVAQVIY